LLTFQLETKGIRNIFVVSFNGAIRFQRRLDFTPTCCVSFVPSQGSSSVSKILTSDSQNHYMVASQEHTLAVYKDVSLIWLAKMHSAAASSRSIIGMAVSSFADVNGFIVTVDEGATVSVLYMGTDPPVHSIRFEEQKELDYSAMELEHRYV